MFFTEFFMGLEHRDEFILFESFQGISDFQRQAKNNNNNCNFCQITITLWTF